MGPVRSEPRVGAVKGAARHSSWPELTDVASSSLRLQTSGVTGTERNENEAPGRNTALLVLSLSSGKEIDGLNGSGVSNESGGAGGVFREAPGGLDLAWEASSDDPFRCEKSGPSQRDSS